MLYTSPFGERKLRIFNMAYQVTNNVNTYFKQVNAENYMQFLVKQKLSKLELSTNKMVIGTMVMQVFICLTASSYDVIWRYNSFHSDNNPTYLGLAELDRNQISI